ncbi:DNA mismatch endonuclease Vsr [Rhizobium lentis]|uniref:very short patch repair endonuclease n=1 Tax=Rhizobium lentis TaxID=1138194 RepID=UPI001C82FF73|nr:very short patch repair endonuclease [Rhizobium lentis]MBX5082675.1 DNA mismatch endonuclease Vsr [Rhizobium lentis]MBX5096184.1 DNA mismatch endonuclease Vsr [Rhizobium lentis]MBX5119969.1 DNA mismatch endonuclease Vsr [Rhizobium lentis]
MESKEHISWRMSRIRGKNTAPELSVRRLTFSMGYRYRLHCKEIIGRPDLVFKKRKKAIFVHGCFWHGHDAESCRIAHMPKSNSAYWQAKLERNAARDASVQQTLRHAGWDCLVIWECQLKDGENLATAIKMFLGQPQSKSSVRK